MIAQSLAEWGIGTRAFPDEVCRAAARHLYDGTAAALGALRTGDVPAAVGVAIDLGGPGESTVLGHHGKVSAPGAALANGSLVHALDFDDTHAGGLVHATAVVLPAALAVGEQVSASGSAVLEAAVVGYESVCRIAAAAPNGFHARGVHATMAAGVFSSAIVAARLMGLDATTTAHALGIAGSQAGGLLAFLATGSSTKQLHAGFASQAGVIAARLAAAGGTGPDTVFEGPFGVYDALTEGPVDVGSITDGLGERWETMRIGIKPYPACQLSHASLDATKDALAQRRFTADDVDHIVALVHPDSATVVCAPDRDLARPASSYGAKFSLPWSVASLIVDGGALGLDSFTPESILRPEVTALAERVRIEVGAADGVAADASGSVRIVLRDGSELIGEVVRSAGGPANPLSDSALVSKGDGLLGTDSTELFEAWTGLGLRPDVNHLLGLITSLTDNFQRI